MARPVQDLGGPLQYRVEPRSGATWVALDGNINEVTDFAPLYKLQGPLVVDLGEVERINSLGVRNWIGFVHHIESTGLALTVERCPPVMVSQMSMISNFMGHSSRVKSALAPYLCPSCKHEHLQLVEIAPGGASIIGAKIPCPKCQTPMEIDELPETYTLLFPAA